MKRPTHALLAALLLGTPCAAQEWTPPGKTRTDRSIELRIVAEAPPDRVYELWTTVEGVRRFFGQDAEIDHRAGGAYAVFFLPREHPDADVNSSAGATLLRVEPDRLLAFEWSTRPLAPQLEAGGMPLWVEVQLTPLGPEEARTGVVLRAHGYGRGGQWETVYEYDVRAWSEILYALDRVLIDSDYRPEWISGRVR